MPASELSHTPFLLMKAARILRNALEKALAESGITAPQFSLLKQIEQDDGRMTAARAADILQIDRPTVSAVLRRLEDKGMVARTALPTDRRAELLSLTESGRAAVVAATHVTDRLAQEMAALCADEQNQAFSRHLEAIIAFGAQKTGVGI